MNFWTGLNPMGFFFFGGGGNLQKTLECFGGKKCWQRIWMEHFDAEICWFHDGIILGEGLKAWSKEFQWLKHIKTILSRYVRERLFRGWSIWRNCVEICYGLLRMDRFTKLFSSIQWETSNFNASLMNPTAIQLSWRVETWMNRYRTFPRWMDDICNSDLTLECQF